MKNNFEKKSNSTIKEEEIKPEKPEITLEIKQKIAETWKKVILGKEVETPDLSALDNRDLGRWLNDTLMESVGQIVDEQIIEHENKEANLPSQQQEVTEAKRKIDAFQEKMASSENPEQKLETEIDFLKQIQIIINALKSNQPHNNKWNSWPLTIKENKGANCHGTAMMTEHLLKKGFKERYFGNPVGHSVNLVRLSDDSWMYIDLTNRKLLRLHPKVSELEEMPKSGGSPYLEINEPELDYQMILVCDINSYPANGVAGNIKALAREAKEDSSDEDHRLAADFYQRFPKELDVWLKNHRLFEDLYPDLKEYHHGDLWHKEEERVSGLRMEKYIKRSLKFAKDNIKEIEKGLLEADINDNMGAWENYFLSKNIPLPAKIKNEYFIKFIEMLKEELNESLPIGTEMRETITNKIVNRLSLKPEKK